MLNEMNFLFRLNETYLRLFNCILPQLTAIHSEYPV